MNKNSGKTLIARIGIFGLLLLPYPSFSCIAQQSQNPKIAYNQEAENALQIVRKNSVANTFYTYVKALKSGWTLKKADYSSGGLSGNYNDVKLGDTPGSVTLFLEKRGKLEVEITIYEYILQESAKSRPTIWVQQGSILECRDPECGDEGIKYYLGLDSLGQSGAGFRSLQFRKGRFVIDIYTKSEKVAHRFAGYALKSVANL
jgi:hypothetical protein